MGLPMEGSSHIYSLLKMLKDDLVRMQVVINLFVVVWGIINTK